MQTTVYAGSLTFEVGERVGSAYGPATIVRQYRDGGGMAVEIETDEGRTWKGLPHHCTFGLALTKLYCAECERDLEAGLLDADRMIPCATL